MSPKPSLSNNNNNSSSFSTEEWVEIIEPKSKKKIYANLESGICANSPPEGAIVSRSEDFSDHWWELYDQKTGKYYYYNPEQQKTAWSKPKEPTLKNGDESKRRLLIIPVSKLQTFKRLSSNEQVVEKCDASTQTIAQNLVNSATQTISQTSLESNYDNKFKNVNQPLDDSSKFNSCIHSTKPKKSHMNHRQTSDFNHKDRDSYLRNRFQKTNHQQPKHDNLQESHVSDTTKSSQAGSLRSQRDVSSKEDDNYISYFGPPSLYGKDHMPLSIQSPTKLSTSRDDYLSSTTTFGSNSLKPSIVNNSTKQPRQMTTNNLSHYLVREARAMGIALISDDELDDDDHISDEDCIVDDEDTDLRDDLSSHHGPVSDLNASQELGEDSSEGWKSFSDQDSPNSTVPKSHHSTQKSPIHCETTTFNFNELIDDQKNPSSCLSQQLDHRKLVENFKKSRQTSSFGLQDSLGRSTKLVDANQAAQRIKAITKVDNYFSNGKDHQSDKLLRQLSALSTLPRPHKETRDRIALSKQEESSQNLDADYDIVEENCGYYSDSEQNPSIRVNSSLNLNQKSNLSGDSHSPSNHFDRNKSSRGSTFSVESFARENLSRHPKKGGLLFNRKVKWSRMISWTKNSIKQPMISSVSSDLNTDSIASFKLIQQFMGDRKVSLNKRYRQILAESGSSDSSPRDISIKGANLARSSSMNAGSSSHSISSSNLYGVPDRLRDELSYELVVKGCIKSTLRDEIYVQMARQLTDNPNQESIVWGLVLMSILLSYFSPSSKFSPFLLSFLETHSHQMARDVCLPRLEKRLRQNRPTYCRKPADGKEISIVRLSITKWPQYCGVFGESLQRIMSLQSCSPYLKTLRLPWILTTLGKKLIETGGLETEGIFRCAADHDLIAQLRLEIDCVDFRKITDSKQVHSLLSNVQDPHVIAGLLKLFFRQLYEPVFPSQTYEICLQNGHDPHATCRIFNERLPNLNKDVVAYLIRLLQILSMNENVINTKMDNSNLSMVWAPNLLRLNQEDEALKNGTDSKNGSKWSIVNGGTDECYQSSVTSSQSMIFERTRQEMQFIRSLIINLDTSFIENVS